MVTGHDLSGAAVLDGFTITAGNADGGVEAHWNGGGMYNWQSSPTLTSVTFRGNRADWYGGGMYNRDDSSPELTNVTFRGNEAEWGGGMYNRDDSSPTLTNVAFSGDSAGIGGGMLTTESSPTLTNVTFSGNRADWAGGMYNFRSYPTLVNCILWSNAAANRRDEIHNIDSTPTISHSTVAGSGGSGADWDGGLGTDGGGNIDADPEFVSPVPAAEAPTTNGNDRLTQGSPAIDAGTNEAVTVDTDLDGNPRIVDGTGDGNPVVDMGAYEFRTTLSVYLPLAVRNR